LIFLDKHLNDIVNGRVEKNDGVEPDSKGIICFTYTSYRYYSAIYRASPMHFFYEAKIIDQAKKMLLKTDHSIAEIAHTLTYDPSNFSKFFKKITGQTPGAFRKINNI